MNKHEQYMQRCLELAATGRLRVAPNPMVGSVLVHNDKIIGEGYHEYFGGPHAEVNAIRNVTDKSLLSECSLYVNLEPCDHFGKTPPCSDLIVESKIPRVFIGSVDSNAQVSGAGIRKLENAGVEVVTGILQDECRELNKRFFTFHEKQRPYIILKWAQSQDGFVDHIRTADDENKPAKISNEASRLLVHHWRAAEQAILVGTNTALLDNPQLTVRLTTGKNPVRILIDKWLRVPRDFSIYNNEAATIVFTAEEHEAEGIVEFVRINFNADILAQIMAELNKRNIRSLFVEGGVQMINSFLSAGLWDEARIFIAPHNLHRGLQAPVMSGHPLSREMVGHDELLTYRKNAQ